MIHEKVSYEEKALIKKLKGIILLCPLLTKKLIFFTYRHIHII